jgi:enoyl-CoA hydratase
MLARLNRERRMSESSAYESLRLDRDGFVAEIVLLGPGKGNAMGPAFWRELPQVLEQLHRDDSVRAILIRGSGANFSYGLDIAGMMGDLGPLLAGENLAATRTELHELIGRMQRAFDLIADGRKPVVGAIHGWCIGGGVDLISACDVRVCSADAKFSVREVRLAITADVGSLQRLPKIIGDGQTRRLALTGEDFDAARALRIGLVSDVYETPEQLLIEARRLTQAIAANPPLVVQGVKRVMNYSQDKSVADGLKYVALWNSAFLQSEDFAEAVSAFVERRPPQYKGR